MSDITIPINIPQTGEVNFTFTSPFTFDPNSKFPEQAFDKDGAIRLASISAKANKKFTIGETDKNINFSASGEFLAALGVYRKKDKLFDDLKAQGIEEKILELLNLQIANADNLMVLRWGYKVGGDANGQVAFSPVKINFGASGSAAAVSAIMRPVERDKSVKDSVVDVIKSWRVPRQIATVDNLDAKSYLITETSGELGLKVGAEYGFSYNWTKEDLTLGGLTGDLGLKIEMGVNAMLNYKISGRYALVLSRETEARKLRAQVFRLKQNGWGFALDAGLSAQLDTTLPPPKVDDFIKGIFNIHGSQVLKDFEKWAFSDASIEELLGQELSQYAQDLVKKVTGIDVLATATAALKKALKFWHDLPHKINSLLFDFLEKNIDLSEFRTFLQTIIDWNESDKKLSEFIETKLTAINFFRTPIGKFLNVIANDGILSLLANIKDERAKLVEIAKKIKAVLDGDTTEEILKKLQEFINKKLGLDKLENLDIDEWLKKRLADFLGKIPGVAELNKIKDAIRVLKLRADELYLKGIKALTDKYSLDLNYSFQKSTSRSALIDITIDFDEAGEVAARGYLEEVLSGKFSRLLTNNFTGVMLNQAILTHEIKRNSHLQINSPFGKVIIDHINKSITSAKAIDSSDGRIWMFSVEAEDIKKRRKNISKLAISADIYEKSGVRVFEKDSYRLRYKYILAKKKSDVDYVERRLKSGVNNYLLPKFPAGKNFTDYLIDIDKALDGVSNDRLGNMIASLQVTLPGEALSVWTKLPGSFTDNFYKDASRIIQTNLRNWVPRGFIFDPEGQYKWTDWVYPLFAWAALPVQSQSDGEGIYYWKYLDDNTRINTLDKDETRDKLEEILSLYITEIPQSERSKYIDPDFIIEQVAKPKVPLTPIVSRFLSLCELERKIMKGIVGTAKPYKKFTQSNNINEKLKYLTEFGSELTETFNDDLGGEYAGKNLRPLGLQLMLEIGKLLDSNLKTIKPTAMLEMMVVNPEIDFTVDQYLEGDFPESKKLALEQRIVNVGT